MLKVIQGLAGVFYSEINGFHMQLVQVSRMLQLTLQFCYMENKITIFKLQVRIMNTEGKFTHGLVRVFLK